MTTTTQPTIMVFKARFHRRLKGNRTVLKEGPAPKPPPGVRRSARVAIALALTHKIEQFIAEGKRRDRAHAAQCLGLTRARLTLICDLSLLLVGEQERLRFLEVVYGREPITERPLRRKRLKIKSSVDGVNTNRYI